MTLDHKIKDIGLGSDKRLKESAKSEGHDSEYDEEDYSGKIYDALQDDETSTISSHPSEIGEEAFSANIKSTNINTNPLTRAPLNFDLYWDEKFKNPPK